MLKKEIKFVDYNDQDAEETLYFNLTKTEMVDLIDMEPRIRAWADLTDGPERELTTAEVRELVAILKELMDLSYGIRSEDGKHFRKSPQILQDFKQSAAYDAFIFSMFENPQNAIEFMTQIVPKDLREGSVAGGAVTDGATVVELPQTAERKFEDYSDNELLNMPQDQFQRLIPAKPRDMTKDMLMVAMERKTRAEES